MLRLQMPLLDPTFESQLAPVCCVPEASTPQDTILRKLHCWCEANQVHDMQVSALLACFTQHAVGSTNLPCYHLDIGRRLQILH